MKANLLESTTHAAGLIIRVYLTLFLQMEEPISFGSTSCVPRRYRTVKFPLFFLSCYYSTSLWENGSLAGSSLSFYKLVESGGRSIHPRLVRNRRVAPAINRRFCLPSNERGNRGRDGSCPFFGATVPHLSESELHSGPSPSDRRSGPSLSEQPSASFARNGLSRRACEDGPAEREMNEAESASLSLSGRCPACSPRRPFL